VQNRTDVHDHGSSGVTTLSSATKSDRLILRSARHVTHVTVPPLHPDHGLLLDPGAEREKLVAELPGLCTAQSAGGDGATRRQRSL